MNIKKRSEFDLQGRTFYISPYLPKKEKYKKHYLPAAQTKVDYIRSKLPEYGSITICVNCSLTVDSSIFLPKTIIDEYGKCRVLFSISSTKRFLLPISGLTMLLSVFFYVLFHVKKGDTVILYHSIYYDPIVTFLKKLKKFKIVYEIEEIYADVRDGGNGREKEITRCEKAADAFIFSTEMLNEAVNKNHKKNIVIYGAYKACEREKTETNADTRKTIVVYSGTLMAGKGASHAVECARALDSSYEIRIIGYGSAEEIDTIKYLIEENKSDCKVVFDGMKYGDEYIEYLYKCDIGLCIQPHDNQFNATSFPSKILSYLNCGLKVVATNLEALKKSKLSELISFSADSTPNEVAKAIKIAMEKKVNNSEMLNKLDGEVVLGLFSLLE